MTFQVIARPSYCVDDATVRRNPSNSLTPWRANQMSTMEEYAGQPREQRMARLTRTADELAAAIKGQSDAVLSRRPDAKNWAAKEIVCHLRGTEEVRVMDVDPRWGDSNADRMAEERQYLRNDAEEALVAFRRRRAETLDLFTGLAPGQWEKSGIHPVRGRFTIDAVLSIMAWHDD